ncbi:MAG: type II secretion system protein GspG [Actinomycetota bacterium]
MYHKKERGFTLIELTIVLVILAVLAGIAVPSYLNLRDRSKESATKSEMSVIATGLETYRTDSGLYPSVFDTGTLSAYIANYSKKDEWQRDYLYVIDNSFENYSLTSLGIDGVQGTDDIVFVNGIMTYDGKFGSILPQATSISSTSTTSAATTTTMLTPLGNTFTEITDAMIKLEQDYYDRTGRWPRSWVPYSFTDLGLDPADWQKPNDHIYYSTGGNRLMVKPETGYILQFTDAKTGTIKTLSYNTKWNLMYSMDTGKWYFHDVQPENEIFVTDLKVIKA